jgi:chemotaxis protein CheD
LKLVGGGRVLAAMSTDIGARNIDFVRQYVKDEGFNVVGEDLGDIYPRKVVYFPDSGKIRVKRFAATTDHTLVDRERSYLQELDSKPIGGEVELF